MRDALTNLLRMQPQNLIPEVNYLAAFVWLMVLVCAFFSVKSQKIGLAAKTVWMIVIVCLPFAGLLAYCFFCLTKLEIMMLPAFTAWQQKMGGHAESKTEVLLPLKTSNLRRGESKPPQKKQAPRVEPIVDADRLATDGQQDGVERF